MRRLATISLILFFAGCATILSPWTQLKDSEYKDNARCFSATIPNGWMRFNLVGYFVITKDGTVLDQIIVERGKIEDKLEFTKKKALRWHERNSK